MNSKIVCVSLAALVIGCSSSDEEVQPIADTDVAEVAADSSTTDTSTTDTSTTDTSTTDTSTTDTARTDTGTADTGTRTDTAVGEVASDSGADAAKPSGTVQILNVSDWHGQIEPIQVNDRTAKLDSTYGGIGLLSAYFATERAAFPTSTAIVTAGDSIGATPPISVYGTTIEDEPTIRSLNFLKLDVNTFGNHDFDRTIAHLNTLKELAEYTFVSSNLTNVDAELNAATATKKVAKPFHMMTLGGVKVAFLGITNPDAPGLLFPGRMQTLTIQEPIAAATAAATAARAAGAHVVIALAHLGATGKDASNNPTGPLIEFAKGLTNVDLVLGDHTSQVVNQKIGNAWVTECLSKGRQYGRTKITVVDGAVTVIDAAIVDALGKVTRIFDTGAACTAADAATVCPSQKCKLTTGLTTGTCVVECPSTACAADYTCNASKRCEKVTKAPDPAAATLMAPWSASVALRFDVKIGTTTASYPGGSISSQPERKGETILGDFLADALLAKYRTSHGAQIALTNAGGIRSSLPSEYTPATPFVRTGCTVGTPCDLLLGDAYTILSNGNVCVVRKIVGSVLWDALEHGVKIYPSADGRFPQIAGFKFEFSAAAVDAGSRVLKVTIVDDTKTCPATACGMGFVCNTTSSLCERDVPRGDTTEYTLVTNDFTNAGGDTYTMLKETVPSAGLDVMADVFVEYIKARTPVTAVLGNRAIAR